GLRASATLAGCRTRSSSGRRPATIDPTGTSRSTSTCRCGGCCREAGGPTRAPASVAGQLAAGHLARTGGRSYPQRVTSADTPKTRSRAARIGSYVGLAVGLAGVGFLTRLVIRDWDEISDAVGRAEPGFLLTSLVLGLGGMCVIGLNWVYLVRRTGERAPLMRCLTWYFVAQLGKYVPGGGWRGGGRAGRAGRGAGGARGGGRGGRGGPLGPGRPGGGRAPGRGRAGGVVHVRHLRHRGRDGSPARTRGARGTRPARHRRAAGRRRDPGRGVPP